MDARKRLILLQQEAHRLFMKTITNTPLVDFIADHLIANGVTFNGWVSVTKRLPHFSPNKWRKVIVTMEDDSGKRFTTTAIYNEKEKAWYAFADRRYENFKVIAWMLKPEVYDGN